MRLLTANQQNLLESEALNCLGLGRKAAPHHEQVVFCMILLNGFLYLRLYGGKHNAPRTISSRISVTLSLAMPPQTFNDH